MKKCDIYIWFNKAFIFEPRYPENFSDMALLVNHFIGALRLMVVKYWQLPD